MDFYNKYHFSIPIFGREIWVTDTIISTWVICAVLIILAIIVRIRISKFKDRPKGFQNVVEIAVESMDNFVKDTMTPKYAYFGRWFFGVFAFILISNLSGLTGILRPPTADLATTVAFAITTFFLIHFMGIITQKGQYFKSYLEPIPFFLPINIVGELAVPISLSFRLFGNILGGFIIMGLVYSMLPVFARIAIPAPLHIYFDMFSGMLQSFIFCILSMTFIKGKLGIDD